MTQSLAILEQRWRSATQQFDPASSLRRLAYHEAAHVAAFCQYGCSVAWAYINERGGQTQPNPSKYLTEKDWLVVLAASGAAERRAGFADGRCSDQDYLDVVQHSRGMSSAEADAAWKQALDYAPRVVERQWKFIEACAAVLLDRGELRCAEIDALWDRYGDRPDPRHWLASQHAAEPELRHRDWTMAAAPWNRAEVELRYRPGVILPMRSRPAVRPPVEDDDDDAPFRPGYVFRGMR